MQTGSSSSSLQREPSDPSPDPLRTQGMVSPAEMLASAVQRGEFATVSRRAFVGLSLALAACAGTAKPLAKLPLAKLPQGEWAPPPEPAPQVVFSAPVAKPEPATTEPAKADAQQVTATGPQFNPIGEAALPWAKPRFLWAKAPPIKALVNPMLPVTTITVHHDGLDQLIWSTDQRAMAERIERYRVGHLARGWGDIGYHLVIDRSGVLWQGRSIRWQGAHVKNHNEGNIGVLVMGNFEEQKPTAAQIQTLRRVIVDLRRVYGVREGQLYTHREWPNADTLCPGRNLQPRVSTLRHQLRA